MEKDAAAYLRALSLPPWEDGAGLEEIAARAVAQAEQYGIMRRAGFFGWAYLYYQTRGAFADYAAICAGLERSAAAEGGADAYILDLLRRSFARLRRAEK